MLTKRLDRNEEFEFYYLVELTKQKIKPLSRWEKPTDTSLQNYIRKHGLFLDIIPRKTFLRTTVYETIFSTSSRYIECYKRNFENTLLKRDEISQKREGYLFGYPSCCVEAFIKKPYSKNNIPKEDQSLLFHWACSSCRVTPELIPYYKDVHSEVKSWYENEISKQSSKIPYPYKKQLKTAFGTLLFSAGMLIGQTPDCTHYIPLTEDVDSNGLSYAEEIYLGAYEKHAEPHACCSFANDFKLLIDALPDSIQIDKPYKINHMMWGLVQCAKCGESVNMGYIEIVNPLRNLTMEIPYLALHYMEKGYFTYESDLHNGRVNIDSLKKILFPYDEAHMLSVAGDTDDDGLTNAEEDSLWLNSSASDTDHNGVPDGAQIAEELIRLFPKLKTSTDSLHSSVIFHSAKGLENCQVCGSIHNMGYVEISNHENGKKMQIPFVALHSLAHGSFAYNGTEHPNGKLDAVDVIRTMKTHVIFTTDDTDNDGLSNGEEEYFDLDITKVDSDDDGIPDVKELTSQFVTDIEALPTEPRIDGPYIEYIGMDGIHLCSVCGAKVVMGIMNIYNPLINTVDPFEINNYAFHFMKKGSFEHEGLPDWWGDNNRVDLIKLSDYLYGHITDIDDEGDVIPKQSSLQQNYPNPFNPVTSISYEVPKQCLVELKVFDTRGREVAVLVNEKNTSGKHTVEFNAGKLSSGIYFYRLKASNHTLTKKMVLIK